MHEAIKVAVATKDGISTNLHFGHAKSFWVYQLSPEGFQLLDRRDVDHYCHGQHGDQSALTKILHTIADCQAVFVAKIGDGPAEKLRAVGVEAVDDYAYEAIAASLQDYLSKKRQGAGDATRQ